MPKVTYLIGAGASADGLPVVKTILDDKGDILCEGLPDAFTRVGRQIYDGYKELTPNNNGEILQEQFSQLAKRTLEFQTVDTYAKYCYLTDKALYKKVKKLIVLYFIIDQVWNKKFDKRYLSFITTILDESNRFPDNIKILNWNYDCQFQLACKYFNNQDPLMIFYPGMETDSSGSPLDENKYSLVHLNGLAGCFKGSSGNFLSELDFNGSFKEFINQTVKSLESYENLLTFAWERISEPTFKGTLPTAREIVKGSHFLVIIGYSFPFFNRKVDESLLHQIINGPGFKKIYYQDKFRTGDFLRNQFKIPANIEIVSISKVDQLHIPFEL